jgi:hypothetical protein
MVGGVNLSERGSVEVSRDAKRSAKAVNRRLVVLGGDPHDLAIREAGCLGEDHRVAL